MRFKFDLDTDKLEACYKQVEFAYLHCCPAALQEASKLAAEAVGLKKKYRDRIITATCDMLPLKTGKTSTLYGICFEDLSMFFCIVPVPGATSIESLFETVVHEAAHAVCGIMDAEEQSIDLMEKEAAKWLKSRKKKKRKKKA